MFRFTCHPPGGEKFEVVARSRAIAGWENAPGQNPRGPKRAVGDLTKTFRMADMVDVAWYAAEWLPMEDGEPGKTGLDIQQWRKKVDVEIEKYGDDDDEAGPTEATP